MGLAAWVERDKVRPVEVTSPLPPDECVRRLARVTTSRMAGGWYLDWRTATRPDPLFNGTVEPSRVCIRSFRDTQGRYGQENPVWFDVRVDPGPDGGTVLAGTAGSRSDPRNSVLGLAVLAVFAVLGLVFFIIGIVIAASGHFNLGVAAAIGVPVLVAFSILVSRDQLTWKDEGRVPPLLRAVCGVLDATWASSDPGLGAGTPSPGG